ncbi:unnamed protein product [Lactuca saligna]|uniref:Uncharacterized protein n=1 Tax=Lactuca saligna TaxID=75948 RepID=A0AA35Z2T0_LACSI|nr:unnamed protein product [Lactuca saligna]
MLKRVDPTNPVLITYLKTIDTSVETSVLLAREEEKKSKRSKKTAVGSSDTKVKPSRSSKSPKKVPITEVEPIQPEPIVADTQLTQKEVIPSKTGVFRRIKMKSKDKIRSPITNVIHKPQVSHQGVIFREIPAPASPSSKKRMATDIAKHISKKKKGRVIISSESTTDDSKTISETPEVVLIKDSSDVDTSYCTTRSFDWQDNFCGGTSDERLSITVIN